MDYPRTRPAPRKKQRIFRRTFLTLVLLVLGLGVWSVLIEPNRLVVRHEAITIASWPKDLSGIRIGVLSDIHTGGPFIDEKKLRQIVQLTNEQHPDLIVLLGDYMSGDSWHGHRVAPEVTAAVLKDLRAPLGVYAVLGNHDWWYNGQKCRRAFEAQGIRILENEVAEIKWRDQPIWLAGLSDLWTQPQRIEETVAEIPDGSAIIALTHNPDIFPNLPQRVPLLLAGHTHGGQVNLPFIGTPIVPSRFGPKYTRGLIFENGHVLFVTSGIGISILPVRFRVPPEIVLLTINSDA